MDRRALLGSLATLGSAGLTGCLGGETDAEPTASSTLGHSPTGTPTAEPEETLTRTPTPAPATPSPSPTPAADRTVDAGPDGRLVFDPQRFTVGVGETVAWVFRSIGHNAKPTSIPDGSTWMGTPGDDFTTVPADFVHRHAFSVPGAYEYVCVPHRGAGMAGSFTVEP